MRLWRITNRRLFQKKTLLDFVSPYNLIPKYKGESGFAVAPALRGQDSEKTESCKWSSLLDKARTFFTENS
jgi:hypothetical protein